MFQEGGTQKIGATNAQLSVEAQNLMLFVFGRQAKRTGSGVLFCRRRSTSAATINYDFYHFRILEMKNMRRHLKKYVCLLSDNDLSRM